MRIVVSPEYETHRGFFTLLPTVFDTEGETVYQGRNVVKRFTHEGKEWIVKRYKRPNLVQRIAYTFFKKSKAERAFLYAGMLKERGIGTPEAIACIELKAHGLISDSFFISEVCHDPAVFPALVQTPDFDKRLADELAAFFVQMHSKGFLHGDPNLTNILYREEGKTGFAFSVIDTNRSLFKKHPGRKECLDNLKRVTHRRDLLRHIVTRYTVLRGWDIEESVQTVIGALEKFEKRRKMKRAFKKQAHI